MAENIIWQNNKVTYEDRIRVLGQDGLVLWFTGLSASGKSTIAIELEKYLNQQNLAVYLLDGDNIRSGINTDLGFSDEDRFENIRRITEVASLFQDAGIITLVAFISPFREMRNSARNKIADGKFIEIYVKADIETCIKRDPKGLYQKQIPNFTGISSPYEEPIQPELILDTMKYSAEECVLQVLEYLQVQANLSLNVTPYKSGDK